MHGLPLEYSRNRYPLANREGKVHPIGGIMKKILIVFCLLSLISIGHDAASASSMTEEQKTTETEEILSSEDDRGDVVGEEEHPVYIFPEIKPFLTLTGGYRIIDMSGSERAAEYEYPSDSLMLLGEFRTLPFPHRIHLEMDLFDRKDYFWDASYAYKDLVLSRWINKTMFHNLEDIRLADLGPDERFTVQNSPSEKYGIVSGMNVLFLRLKMPDFPLHVYIDGQFIDKEGKRQQRFLGGSGYFNDLMRVSRKREVDLETKNINVGVNAHMGPVEIDISHGEKRLDSGGDRVFYDLYGAAGSRAEGMYPHNIIPDLKGSSDTLKLHTSYTGKLVASLTLSQYSRENEYSGCSADYFFGSTDVTWMPIPRLTFFFKYRHKETDVDNPEVTTVSDLLNPSNTYTYMVRQSISSDTDSLAGTARFRVSKGITVNAGITHKSTERQHAEEWGLPETTVKDTVSVSVSARIARNLTVRSKYVHEQTDEPAYNSELDSKDKGTVSVSWTPLPFLFTYLSYDISSGSRDNLFYTVSDQQITVDGRTVHGDRLLGMLGFTLAENLSLSTSYAYLRDKTRHTLVYGQDSEPQAIIDENVRYREEAHTIAANLNYRPKNPLELGAGVSFTDSKASFSPSAYDAVNPVSIADFSETRIRHTEYNLSGNYDLKDGWEVGMRYFYSKYDERAESALNPSRDGDAHIVLLNVTKRWR